MPEHYLPCEISQSSMNMSTVGIKDSAKYRLQRNACLKTGYALMGRNRQLNKISK